MVMESILILVIGILLYKVYIDNKILNNFKTENKLLINDLNELTTAHKKLFSQKKSSEVRTGHIAEKFVPFLNKFKHRPDQTQFIGNPIDYLIFGDDAITFIEVKSGNARLSNKQKHIKNLVLNKQVEWEEIRIK
jgi:hypothetical protein